MFKRYMLCPMCKLDISEQPEVPNNRLKYVEATLQCVPPKNIKPSDQEEVKSS